MDTLRSHIAGTGAGDDPARLLELVSPADPARVTLIAEAAPATVERAVAAAHDAYREHLRRPLADRIQWLARAADLVEQRAAELADALVADIGKPIRPARVEVRRGAEFLRACAATLPTLNGETLALDAAAAGAGRIGLTRRIPYGTVAAITPFNAPINLLVQKIGPALGAGNAVVAKPHPAGTRAALMMAEILAAAGLPAGLFNVIAGDREPAARLAAHPLVRVVTFTGGTAAGDALAAAARAKKFVAELGSNAANIVLADADLEDAARRIAAAGFEAGGQQCVSAQRVIVDARVHDRFLDLLVQAARALKVGDPHDPTVDLGPLVSEAAADRVMAIAERSIAAGARFALEPRRSGPIVSPGILVDAPLSSPIWSDEVFGPLLVVQKAADAGQALELANDSPFGLQGSVFTNDLAAALRFAEEFEVGALWINEASRFRLDGYPFGGVKQSGFGREGVRYAIEEMSQIKFIGIRPHGG